MRDINDNRDLRMRGLFMKIKNMVLSKEPRLAILNENRFDLSYVFDEREDLMYSSGSVIEGYGDRFSDVDIYILTNKKTLPTDDDMYLPVEGTKFGYNGFSDSEHGFYVEFILNNYDWGRKIISKINRIDPSLRNDITQSLDYRQLDFYYRLAIGIPLCNERGFADYTEDVSKSHISDIISTYKGLYSAKYLRYAGLYYESGINDAAYYYAQRAINEGIDSYMARNGEPYQSFKLRLRKIRNRFGADSPIYHWACDLSALGSRKYGEYYSEAVAFCEELGVRDYFFAAPNDITYVVNNQIELIEFIDSFALISGSLYSVDSRYKKILSSIKGSTQITLSELKRICQSAFGTPDGICEAINYLEAKNIIALDWGKEVER